MEMNQVWTRLKQRYLQPETDGEAQRKAVLLSMMLHMTMSGAIIIAVVPLFLHSSHLGRDYALLGFVIAGIVGIFRLLQRRYVQAASWGWTLLLWGSTTIALWTSEGFRSGVAYGYFLVVIVAAALLRRREVLLFGGLCFLSNASFFYYQQWRGLLTPERLPITQVHWVFLNIILAVATFLLSSTTKNTTNALRQIRDSAQALEEKTLALRAYADRLEIEQEIDRAILAAESPRAIAQAALAHLQPLIPNLLSSVIVFDLKQQQMESLVTYARGERVPEMEKIFYEVDAFNIAGLAAGQVQHIPDLSPNMALAPLYQYFYEQGMRSYIHVPLLAQGELVGSLNLGADSPHFFTDTHLEIAQEIATSLAVAMRHAQLYEQVQQNAVTQSHLVEEINHRVGNNLTAIIGLLHIERRFIPEGEMQQKIGATLNRLEQRITALAEVHKMFVGKLLDAGEFTRIDRAAHPTDAQQFTDRKQIRAQGIANRHKNLITTGQSPGARHRRTGLQYRHSRTNRARGQAH